MGQSDVDSKVLLKEVLFCTVTGSEKAAWTHVPYMIIVEMGKTPVMGCSVPAGRCDTFSTNHESAM